LGGGSDSSCVEMAVNAAVSSLVLSRDAASSSSVLSRDGMYSI
jgi:hypothetical protein